MKEPSRKLARLGLLLWLTAGAAAADALPRLELGVGLVTLAAPDYRGSRHSSSYLLPTPYVKYRGERLEVDEGARGILYRSEDLSLTLSGNLSLPSDDGTSERAGMEELDVIVEFGPSANYRLLPLADSDWWLDLPLRFAYAVDGLDAIGYVLQPRLSWRKPARRLGEWKLRFNTGPLYSSADHHAYFYSVDAAEATATRPAYSADGGYSGLRSEFTWSKRIGRYWFGGFLRHDSLDGAAIEDSPLVSERDSWMTGIGLAWVFHED